MDFQHIYGTAFKLNAHFLCGFCYYELCKNEELSGSPRVVAEVPRGLVHNLGGGDFLVSTQRQRLVVSHYLSNMGGRQLQAQLSL